jgi:hypothetical protein
MEHVSAIPGGRATNVKQNTFAMCLEECMSLEISVKIKRTLAPKSLSRMILTQHVIATLIGRGIFANVISRIRRIVINQIRAAFARVVTSQIMVTNQQAPKILDTICALIMYRTLCGAANGIIDGIHATAPHML